jgi:outer membrane protein assembly factor BamB
MWDLQGLIDQPVPPDPHFSETLRQLLLDDLSAAQPDGDETQALLATLEQAGLARGSHHHLVASPRKLLTVLLELALVAAIVIGANAAIDRDWGQASPQVTSSVDTQPSTSTSSVTSQIGMPNPSGAPVVTPEARTISPAFAPAQAAASASQLMWNIDASSARGAASDELVVLGNRVFRPVVSDAFTGIEARYVATGSLNWQFDMARSNASIDIAGGDKTLFVTGARPDQTTGNPQWVLYALKSDSGAQLWSLDLPGVAGAPISNAAVVFQPYSGDRIMAVNALTGDLLWQIELPTDESIADLSLLAGRLYVTTISGRLLSYDAGNPSPMKEIPQSKGYALHAPVVAGQTLIVVGTRIDATNTNAMPSTLSAYDIAHDFSFVWDRGFRGGVGDPVALADALIVSIPIGRTKDNPIEQMALVRLDLATGKTLWQCAFTSAGFGPLTMTSTPQPMVLAPTAEQVLYGFDLETGARVWTMENLAASRITASNDGVLFGSMYDGSLTVIRPAMDTGSTIAKPSGAPVTAGLPAGVRWQRPLLAGQLSAGSTVVENGFVLRALNTSSFTGLEATDTTTGKLIWRQAMIWTGPLVSADGVVYVPGSLSSGITAIDARSGKTLWQAPMAGTGIAPALSDGTLYVWSSSNIVYALDAATGKKLWQAMMPIDTADDAGISQALLPLHTPAVSAQRVVVTSMGGSLYAFDRATGEQAWRRKAPSSEPDVRYLASGDIIVVVHSTVTPMKPATPTPSDLPGLIEGVDLATGTTRWEHQGMFGAGQPMVAATDPATGKTSVALIAETIQLDASSTNPAPAGTSLYTIDPATGDLLAVTAVTSGDSLSVTERGSLIIWPLAQAGGAPLDLGQAIAGAPVAADASIYVTLIDGSLVAIDENVFIAG